MINVSGSYPSVPCPSFDLHINGCLLWIGLDGRLTVGRSEWVTTQTVPA